MSVLSIIWFCLAAFLLAVYTVMDGFDLGVGIVYGFTKDAARRRSILGAISPVWSGNEVWLLAGIGSLLAAFPPVYSALLSSLYVPVILVLMALIFRACGVELRTKTDSPGLIRFFDAIILGGSLVPAWGIGLVAGNVLVGLPLDASGNLVGSWLFFLNPFALVASLVSVAAFVLHGLLYVSLKVEAKDRPIYVGKAKIAFWAFAGLVAVSAILSPFVLAARFGAAKSLIVFWVFVGLFAVGYSGVFSDLRAGRHGGAFAASAIGLASIVGMSASLLFPVLIPSRLGAANDLSIGNAASPDATLKVILIMACIAVPLIVVYTAIAYRSFRGVAREADK